MEAVKIFSTNEDWDKLEKKINDWFYEMRDKLEITRIFQTQSGTESRHRVIITIFYKKTNNQ